MRDQRPFPVKCLVRSITMTLYASGVQRATEIATEMVTRYGMTEKLGPRSTAAATVSHWNDGEPR
jgi:ATP-dependent Zn protease